MNSLLLSLLVIGTLIIFILAGIALWMWKKVWARQAEHEELSRQIEVKQEANRAYLIESILVICDTILKDEMNISEGAIRLKVLTDNLNYTDEQKSAFQTIELLYQEVGNLDTHQARKDLSKQERMKQDLQRTKAENRHHNEFIAAVSHLKDITQSMVPARH